MSALDLVSPWNALVIIVGVLCVWYAWRAVRYRNLTVRAEAGSVGERVFHLVYWVVMAGLGACLTAGLTVPIGVYLHPTGRSFGTALAEVLLLWLGEAVIYAVGAWRHWREASSARRVGEGAGEGGRGGGRR